MAEKDEKLLLKIGNNFEAAASGRIAIVALVVVVLVLFGAYVFGG